jgi:hypothetical protein
MGGEVVRVFTLPGVAQALVVVQTAGGPDTVLTDPLGA